jgi:hypothetical protein
MVKTLTPLQGAGGFLHSWVGLWVKLASLVCSVGGQQEKP